MSKRPCPFDETVQAIKKQGGNGAKPREIRSALSEKTLQLLYKGAAQQFEKVPEPESTSHYKCSQCLFPLTVKSKCFYCDKYICGSCMIICTGCEEEYCKNCAFRVHDNREAVCYSCY